MPRSTVASCSAGIPRNGCRSRKSRSPKRSERSRLRHFFAGKWHLGPDGYWPGQPGLRRQQRRRGGGSPKSYFSPYGNPAARPTARRASICPTAWRSRTVRFISISIASSRSSSSSRCTTSTRRCRPPRSGGKVRRRKRSQVAAQRPREPSARASQLTCGRCRTTPSTPRWSKRWTGRGQSPQGLREAGVADRTAVFFTSDNGGLSTAEGAPPATCRSGRQRLDVRGRRPRAAHRPLARASPRPAPCAANI